MRARKLMAAAAATLVVCLALLIPVTGVAAATDNTTQSNAWGIPSDPWQTNGNTVTSPYGTGDSNSPVYVAQANTGSQWHVDYAWPSDNTTPGFTPPPYPPYPPTPPYYPPTPPIPPVYPPTPPYHPPTPPTHHWWNWPTTWWHNNWFNPIVQLPTVPPVINAPVISYFNANPPTVNPGQSVILNWSVSNADNVLLSPGVGSVPNTGTFTVMPNYTTTYTLSATNSGGSVSASTTVTIVPVAISSGPVINDPVAQAPASSNPSVFSMGIGGINGLPLYIVFIILLVAATVGIILYMRRPIVRPAPAGHEATSIRLANYSSATAVDAPSTAVIGHGIRNKLFASSGAQVTIPASGMLGREDLKALSSGSAALISREHLRVSVDRGEYYIEDRNSTNGTKVNGTSINGRGRLLLKDGDEIELANAVTLKFRS